MGVARLLQAEDPVHVDIELSSSREVCQLCKVAPRIVAKTLHKVSDLNP
jgi:hypothetical protein